MAYFTLENSWQTVIEFAYGVIRYGIEGCLEGIPKVLQVSSFLLHSSDMHLICCITVTSGDSCGGLFWLFWGDFLILSTGNVPIHLMNPPTPPYWMYLNHNLCLLGKLRVQMSSSTLSTILAMLKMDIFLLKILLNFSAVPHVCKLWCGIFSSFLSCLCLGLVSGQQWDHMDKYVDKYVLKNSCWNRCCWCPVLLTIGWP